MAEVGGKSGRESELQETWESTDTASLARPRTETSGHTETGMERSDWATVSGASLQASQPHSWDSAIDLRVSGDMKGVRTAAGRGSGSGPHNESGRAVNLEQDAGTGSRIGSPYGRCARRGHASARRPCRSRRGTEAMESVKSASSTEGSREVREKPQEVVLARRESVEGACWVARDDVVVVGCDGDVEVLEAPSECCMMHGPRALGKRRQATKARAASTADKNIHNNWTLLHLPVVSYSPAGIS